MRVAERHVGDRHARSDRMRFGNTDAGVGERGASNGAEGVVANHQAVADAEAVADGFKGASFAEFGALAIADVHGRGVMVTGGEGRTDTRIHATAEEDYGSGDRVIG